MSEKKMISVLQTYDVTTGERKVLRRFDEHIEAPNWGMDGTFLVYNSQGHIFRYDLQSGESAQIDTGICTRCNNDTSSPLTASGSASPPAWTGTAPPACGPWR